MLDHVTSHHKDPGSSLTNPYFMECYKGFCDLNHQGSDGHVQAQSPTTGGHI